MPGPKKRNRVVGGITFDNGSLNFSGVHDRRFETEYLANSKMDLKAKRKAALRRLKALRSQSS